MAGHQRYAALASILLSVILLVWAVLRRRALLGETSRLRTAAAASRLRIRRLDLRRHVASAKRPALALQLKVGERAEDTRLVRLRALQRELEAQREQDYERRAQLWQPARKSTSTDAHAVTPAAAADEQPEWHSRGGPGERLRHDVALAMPSTDGCPSTIPEWDWSLLHRAASPQTDDVEREAALLELSARSRISLSTLNTIAHRYESVIASKEFEGIYDDDHRECSGERFASLEGDRVLRIECADPEGARYAVESESTLHEYNGPVRVDEESVLAFCGDEMQLLSHPRRRQELVERAKDAVPTRFFGVRRPSVLIFMIDATSRAHFRRSMPLTLAALEAIQKYGEHAAAAVATEAAAKAKARAAAAESPPDPSTLETPPPPPPLAEGDGRVHVFDFERYNVIGFNSMPNQLPFFCDAAPEKLSGLRGEACVWEMFKSAGAVTMMAEEIHDQCSSVTSTVNAVYKGAHAVRLEELPDHQWWKLFCSQHIKPCCWAQKGFLNPGRRQCVGGGRSLHQVLIGYLVWTHRMQVLTTARRDPSPRVHQVLIGYLEEFWSTYADAPRRWAAVNTMVAHEHFMLRLPSLDADLAALLLRMASSVLRDTVMILLSDHGTHGIWYTEYEIGASEHQLPFLYVLAPDWLLRERPEWLAALTLNQQRLVTVHELYKTMQTLAVFPDAPPEHSGRPSLFNEVPPGRTCGEAGIPDVYCSCRGEQGIG